VCLVEGTRSAGGLGAGGSHEAIARARRWRYVFGGAWRQAGILAAAGLHALHHPPALGLVEDHAAARALADRLAPCPAVRVRWPVETTSWIADIVHPHLDAAKWLNGWPSEGC